MLVYTVSAAIIVVILYIAVTPITKGLSEVNSNLSTISAQLSEIIDRLDPED